MDRQSAWKSRFRIGSFLEDCSHSVFVPVEEEDSKMELDYW